MGCQCSVEQPSHAVEALWEDPTSGSTCYYCRAPFGFFARVHHCMLCGKVVCLACLERGGLCSMEVAVELGYKEPQPACHSCITTFSEFHYLIEGVPVAVVCGQESGTGSQLMPEFPRKRQRHVVLKIVQFQPVHLDTYFLFSMKNGKSFQISLRSILCVSYSERHHAVILTTEQQGVAYQVRLSLEADAPPASPVSKRPISPFPRSSSLAHIMSGQQGPDAQLNREHTGVFSDSSSATRPSDSTNPRRRRMFNQVRRKNAGRKAEVTATYDLCCDMSYLASAAGAGALSPQDVSNNPLCNVSFAYDGSPAMTPRGSPSRTPQTRTPTTPTPT